MKKVEVKQIPLLENFAIRHSTKEVLRGMKFLARAKLTDWTDWTKSGSGISSKWSKRKDMEAISLTV